MTKPNIIPPILTDKHIEGFWGKVDKTVGFGPWGNCWRWTDKPNKDGYGSMGVAEHRICRANRLSYFLHYAEWGDFLVLHSCDVRNCVNPAHLDKGTSADNSADMVAKGRQASGERHCMHLHPERISRGADNGMAKLTDTKVIAIRQRYAEGRSTQAGIARDYRVSKSTVHLIVKRKIWKHTLPSSA